MGGSIPTHRPSSPRKRGPSIPERLRSARNAAAYWVARSSRAMTLDYAASASSSSSLPRRDDLDLVAGLKLCLSPRAARQHVVIQRDRKMHALVFELGQQRLDMISRNLPRLAIDGHAHCITSLSITPRST